MKTSVLLPLSFLLLVFTAGKPSSAASEPVLDIHDEPLRTGTSYYIVSALTGGGGGGLNLGSGRNKTCPLDVIQEPSDIRRGLPLTFSPANGDHNTIYLSEDLNIQFTVVPLSCNQPTVWKVDNYDESSGQWFITTNGVKGNPGAKTLRNWFKIEKTVNWVKGSYKIVHCPSVCESCVSLCSDVGRYFEENGSVRRLALRDDFQFGVVFIKADEYSSRIKEKLMQYYF
ncbi:Kunitz trypsin inhibitor [Melia azedarach]|uniref:Kunitz trypsin inhibitor n=1 Tax=Melia azedarach TaxID=155640 RepID=A0ACC1XQA6_MELAZ|nr:Kunitz trypsin inhibitor [Melia azedarach]